MTAGESGWVSIARLVRVIDEGEKARAAQRLRIYWDGERWNLIAPNGQVLFHSLKNQRNGWRIVRNRAAQYLRRMRRERKMRDRLCGIGGGTAMFNAPLTPITH